MSGQLELFDAPVPTISQTILREEGRFGKWDAKTGLTLRNHYSDRISGERLVAYERAFREERRKWLEHENDGDQ